MKKTDADTVLVVNDNSDQLDLTQFILEQAGYKVLRAEHGAKGLKIATEKSPDLVVSDVMMPVMNGIEMCRRMREIPHLHRVPVLLVSALRVDSKSAIEGFRAGADDYLEIPFEQARFIAKVERLFERKREEEAHIQLVKAQNALRESRTELAYVRFALDEATIVVITDEKGRITYLNDNFCEISKYSREELLGQDHRLIKADHHPDEFFATLWTTIKSGNVWKGEMKNRAKDGSHFWIETTIVPVLDDDQKPQKFIAISHDITESKEAEESLKHSETYFRALIEKASDLISILDPEGRMRYQSPSITTILGYQNEELIGQSCFDYLHPDDLEKARAAFEEIIRKNNHPVEVEIRFLNKKGDWRYFACTLTNLLDNLAIRGIVSNAFDITERKLTEAALRESEERYRILFDNNPLPMWVIDTETLAFQAVNAAAVEHYGYSYEEFLGMTAADIRPPMAEAEFSDPADSLYRADLCKHIKKDGTIIDVEITSHELLFGGKCSRLILINDVTEQRWAEEALRQSEEQLRQSQKLESVGRLAGGIAHDFNNMLTAINGYSDLILKSLAPDDPLRRNVEEIKKAGTRSAELTQQLLAFSRRQIMQAKVLDLNRVISDTIIMLQRLIGEDIQMITSLSPDVGLIEADPGQLSQVLLNLIVNARDAMPKGGSIVIETESLYIDDYYANHHINVKPGDYVMLAVSDTGIGMDEETRQQIFEPFFTTKEMGKGTGLGLSTVYGIVKQSGGNIWVYSEPGKGTTFKIYLPRVAAPPKPAENAAGKANLQRGSETILLVEDEETVRRLSREVLELCGYKVIEAENGIAALNLCEVYKGKIDLLMTDVVMPQMGGRELAETMSQIYPQIRVLFTSGYTDDAIFRHGIIDIGTNFIQKPFTFDALARKVRELFDQPVETRQSVGPAGDELAE
ncbi:MAG: PAS domain S-box protein [Acidobacteria bacterium]|nr:PAS domain S-box protein [Acidobacteriota bacterium]